MMGRDFSWAKYKPSLRNWLLMEFGNTYILEQRQLSFIRLLLVGLRLFWQRTLLSDEHIRKLITQNVKNLVTKVFQIKRKKSDAIMNTPLDPPSERGEKDK
jgi:hypothetical protein